MTPKNIIVSQLYRMEVPIDSFIQQLNVRFMCSNRVFSGESSPHIHVSFVTYQQNANDHSFGCLKIKINKKT